MALSAVDRLSEIIEERDERIAELESEVESLKNADHAWTAHREFKEDPSPSLPVPRLELRWSEKRW